MKRYLPIRDPATEGVVDFALTIRLNDRSNRTPEAKDGCREGKGTGTLSASSPLCRIETTHLERHKTLQRRGHKMFLTGYASQSRCR
jgi:hypothetical protein